jgi:hypothetical protein
VKQTIIPPSGDKLVQFPYRSMNDLNSYSPLEFKVDPEDASSGPPSHFEFEKADHGDLIGLRQQEGSSCQAAPSHLIPNGMT